ncbi:MAG: uridine kinase [Lachnospiraceae bacterium]|nr:uridine kinase [Lachnospiraceae bacterium]
MTKDIWVYVEAIKERIIKLPEGKRIITIDGRCAAGKTTLAEVLAKEIHADIVHMDDFFLPQGLRTPKRLGQPGGNVHYERFQEEVLYPLQEGSAFTYRRFDCHRMEFSEERYIKAEGFTIIEGAYSAHPVFGKYMGLCVFADVERSLQEERIRKRNGEEKLQVFLNKWIPMEEMYFLQYQVKENADLVLQ